MILPREANCWTACNRFVKRGPKHRLDLRPVPRSISAVSRMTSLTSGGEAWVCDLQVRKLAFCSSERVASNSETACANRISGFSLGEVARAASMAHQTRKVRAKSIELWHEYKFWMYRKSKDEDAEVWWAVETYNATCCVLLKWGAERRGKLV